LAYISAVESTGVSF